MDLTIARAPLVPVIGHARLMVFADAEVNLRREDVTAYRAQVERLRLRLAEKIKEDPAYALVKMLHSGSVAKGTALKNVHDLDVAVYVRDGLVPADDGELLGWLAERLRETLYQMSRDQIVVNEHCVTISYRGSGLDVDVVPVLYEGDPDGYGYLVTKDTGERVLTSIPLHLSFIRARKSTHSTGFAQLVRFIKWWVRLQKRLNTAFRFRSFMVEMVAAHLVDGGLRVTDQAEALSGFFTYIVKTGLTERIAFEDNYAASLLPGPTGAPIEIFDPVNPVNNVAEDYSERDRRVLVAAADEALSAIEEARYAATRQQAIEAWQVVLGPSFRG